MSRRTAIIYYAVLFVVGLIMLCFLLPGCKTTKDARATRRVFGDPELSEKVYRQLEKTHPCYPATIVKPGKETIDTVYSNEFVFGQDSIRVDSFESVTVRTVIKKVPVYITKTRVDSVADIRREQLLSKDNAFKDGQIIELQGQVKVSDKKAHKWQWYFWLLVAVIGVTRFLKYRYKIGWL